MPLADRDIIITPNRGASSEPSIAFRGADTATSATVTLKVYNSSTVGTVSFEGAVGQLMTIVDSMAGTIFSANDISGVPSIEVLDTGEVKLAPFNGFVTIAGLTTITNTTAASSTLTGALQVRGGVGIGDDLYVGDSINALGQIISTRANNATTGAGQIYLNGASGNRIDFSTAGVAVPAFTTRSAGTKIVLYPDLSGSQVDYALGIEASGFWSSVPVSGARFKWYAGTTNIAVLEGNGNFTLTQTTNATSTITGVLQVRGGAGIGGNLYVGGTINGNLTGNVTGIATTATNIAGGAAGSIPIQSAAGTTAFIPIGAADYVLQSNGTTAIWVSTSTWGSGGGGGSFNGGTITNALVINSSTVATSTVTGALQVINGGAGIGGDLYVGGTIFGNFNGSGSVTTATNFAAGTAGQVPYQSSVGVTAFTGPGTTGEILVSRGTSGPIYQNTLTLAGTTVSTTTNTGALQVFGGVGIGGNLNVGGTIDGGGVRTTTSASPPTGPTVGDIWYNTNNDVIYRYTNDGVGNYWIDISSAATAESSSTVTLLSTQTLINKRITPRVSNNGATTTGVITPTGDSSDQYEILNISGPITIAIPSGTPTAGQKLIIRLKDDGVSRGLTWVTTAGGYRVIGTTLPTSTTIAKNIYIGCIYNATDLYWDVIAVALEV